MYHIHPSLTNQYEATNIRGLEVDKSDGLLVRGLHSVEREVLIQL